MMEGGSDSIIVQRGFDDNFRHEAAQIYWEAFGRKLQPILGTGDAVIDIFAGDFDPGYSFSAFSGDRLLGIVGLHDQQGIFSHVQLSTLQAHYDWLRGSFLYLLFAIVSSDPGSDELMVESLAVSSEARGMGIGTALLEAAFEHARSSGFRFVGLEVIDTNPRARQLYERMGFVPINTRSIGPFSRIFGFSSSTRMRKKI